MSRSLTLPEVARMRLVSQGLVDPLPGVVDVVRHLTATQGQDHPGSMTSLALRTTGRSREEVVAAYDAGEIVRTWPMRGTLFVVAAEDAGWIGALTREGVRRGTVRRREELGLTTAVLERAEEVAREALSGKGLVRAEMLARWEECGIPTGDGRGYHHLFHLAVGGVICQGPTAGREQRFVLTDEWIPAPRSLAGAEAVAELLLRYVRARGPVPLDDFCWWSKVGKRQARIALGAVQGALAVADVDGVEHWMAADLPDRYADLRRATAAPLLLPGFDEIVLGYGDRSAVLTREEEQRVVPGRNGVFRGTVLRAGHAVGTWRRGTSAKRPVEVEPFGALPGVVERALPRLAADLPG